MAIAFTEEGGLEFRPLQESEKVWGGGCFKLCIGGQLSLEIQQLFQVVNER